MSGTGTRRSMVESVKVCYLFARYFATPVRRSLVSLLVSPLASALRRGWLPRRLREALPGSAAAGDLWKGSKGGGSKIESRCAYFLEDLSCWKQANTYAGLAFDWTQRSGRGRPLPSYAAFHIGCAAAARESSSREVQASASAVAFRDGSPVMCAALQDFPWNMAGEGKLLNIYHSLQRTIDLDVEGDVVELGCHRGVRPTRVQTRPGRRLERELRA